MLRGSALFKFTIDIDIDIKGPTSKAKWKRGYRRGGTEIAYPFVNPKYTSGRLTGSMVTVHRPSTINKQSCGEISKLQKKLDKISRMKEIYLAQDNNGECTRIYCKTLTDLLIHASVCNHKYASYF